MEFSSRLLVEPEYQPPHEAAHNADTSLESHDGDDNHVAQPVQYGFLDVLDILRQYQVPSLDLSYAVGTTDIDERQSSTPASTFEKMTERANR